MFVSFASLVILLASSGCSKVEYFYFDFRNGDVDASDWQTPEVYFYKGDVVPVITRINWNGETLQILNVNRCCVPFLEIRSPFLLSNMTVTTGDFVSDFDDSPGSSCGGIFQKGKNTVLLIWPYLPEPEPTCIRIGDEVSIELVPENGSESLLLHAVLVRSGHYWLSDL